MDTDTAELVATTIFAARSLKEIGGKRPSETEVLEAVMRWKKKRRPPLDLDRVSDMIRTLAALRWVDVTPSGDSQDSGMELAPA